MNNESKKEKSGEIKFGMTGIHLRHALLGVTLWSTCYWVLPFEGILLLGKLASKVSMAVMQLCQLSGIEYKSGKSEPWDDDTLAHEHREGFKMLMFNGVTNQRSDVTQEVEGFEVRFMHMQLNNWLPG